MKSNVCVLTAYTHNLDYLATFTIPHMKEYAKRQGYEFCEVRLGESERGGGWIKIKPILDALGKNYDLVLWLDIDTIVVRKDADIKAAMNPGVHLQMVWHDFHPPYPVPSHYNAGVMLIRNGDWARDFFQRVWNTGQQPHHWTDQAAILHLLGYDDVLHIGPSQADSLDRSCVARLEDGWNVIVGITESNDPIIHHYAGADPQTKLTMIKLDSEYLETCPRFAPDVRRSFTCLLGKVRQTLENLNRSETEKHHAVENLNRSETEKQHALENLNRSESERHKVLESLRQAEQEFETMKASISWKITKPLREVQELIERQRS